MSREVKNYSQLCSLYSLEKLIKSPTRVTISKSSLIDMGVSDHQLIYCTRKFSCTEVGIHKQVIYRSLKNYTAEAYKESPSKLYFPNYENFSDMNKAYENFIKKLMIVIDELVLFRTKRVKGNSQEWFDEEIRESIALRDKLFRKFPK